MASINWTNITDFSQVPAAANTASNDTFWVGMLFMTYIITLLLTLGFGWEIAILVSSFLFLIVSIILAYAELISWSYCLIFVASLIISFLYIVWSSPKVKYS